MIPPLPIPETKIKLLPPYLINRIAAGEVVERPASVIKELVENALDAGATRIDVRVSEAGRCMRVADNGTGMRPEDVLLAFQNHATSKISSQEDLDQIKTLGFRGEALASIASIARVTCITRTDEQAVGSKLIFSAEGEPLLSEAGCAVGSIFEVSDLFYNTPARLKFLKKPQTELAHIEEKLQALALSHPHVQFQYFVNDSLVFRTTGETSVYAALEEYPKSFQNSLLNTLKTILKLPPELEKGLLTVFHEDTEAGLSVTGLMSAPDRLPLLKNSKRWQYVFLNARTVKCAVLGKALESAYESLVPAQKYPVCALFLSIPTDQVDVNVHPSKREVRYVQANTIFSFLRSALQRSLQNAGHSAFASPLTRSGSLPPEAGRLSNLFPVPPFFPQTAKSTMTEATPESSASMPYTGKNTVSESTSQEALDFYQPLSSEPLALNGGTVNTPALSRQNFSLPQQTGQQPFLENRTEGRPNQESWRVVGQLFQTYILLETMQGLMLVDQHIASERALFESFSRQIQTGALVTQGILAVQSIQLSPLELQTVLEYEALLAATGFVFNLQEATGTLYLSQVPVVYPDRSQPNAAQLFSDVLNRLAETGEAKLHLEDMIATLACHHAVRAGDRLDTTEMEQVIQQWLSTTLPWTCPHGRPIAHTIQAEELNRFFERPSLPVGALPSWNR